MTSSREGGKHPLPNLPPGERHLHDRVVPHGDGPSEAASSLCWLSTGSSVSTILCSFATYDHSASWMPQP